MLKKIVANDKKIDANDETRLPSRAPNLSAASSQVVKLASFVRNSKKIVADDEAR